MQLYPQHWARNLGHRIVVPLFFVGRYLFFGGRYLFFVGRSLFFARRSLFFAGRYLPAGNMCTQTVLWSTLALTDPCLFSTLIAQMAPICNDKQWWYLCANWRLCRLPHGAALFVLVKLLSFSKLWPKTCRELECGCFWHQCALRRWNCVGSITSCSSCLQKDCNEHRNGGDGNPASQSEFWNRLPDST